MEPVVRESANLVRTLASAVTNTTKIVQRQQDDISVQLNRIEALMTEKPKRSAEPDPEDDQDMTVSPKSFYIALIALTVHFVDYLISSFFAPRLGIKRHVATKACLALV